MASVPAKILGLDAVSTTHTVALPVGVSVASAGAAIGGVAATTNYRKQNAIEGEFKRDLGE